MLLVSSCLSDEDSYRAGFPLKDPLHMYVYANNVNDSLYVLSYGDWQISGGLNAGWCKLNTTDGKGNYIYSIPVTFEQNTTGQARVAIFSITDINHPNISADLGFLQYATRGDGSLGNAADVRTITGSDSSRVELTYDALHRPVKFLMSKGGERLYDLSLSYNDYDSIITVRSMASNVLTAKMGQNYLPDGQLLSNTDTVMYHTQLGSLESMYSSVVAFNVEFRQSGGTYMAQALRTTRQSLLPDSIHNSDSLRYQRRYADGAKYTEFLKLYYSELDNRCQSVDVNQLLLGVEHCNPYQLISLFRYGRNSNIISRATSESDEISVSTELNADKSVRRLKVSRRGKEITYDFEY